ncbi:MAG: OmpA family protein [Chitinophagales bacterium]
MKKIFSFLVIYNFFSLIGIAADVQWATKLLDFSSEYKDELIGQNSTRWSAVQVLGYPNTLQYGSSQHAWTPKHQNNSKEFVTVGFATPQMVQQVIVGENFNSGSVAEIILYDTKGKKYTVYENDYPKPTQKMNDVFTYFKIKPAYNVVKLKLVINTNASFGREEIDCIGISSTTQPYVQQINVMRYSEPVGQPENLGANVNSPYYDHLPLISPDGSTLYFTRKLTDERNLSAFDDDIFYSKILPGGYFSKAENIGPPLNTSEHNFACYISADNNRLYVANKYVKNTYNYAGLSVSTKQKNNTWSKPKALPIPDLYNKNEFAHYYLNITENVVLMAIQRDDSYGDLDLYVSKKYSDGTWTTPKNLGPTINTVGAEGSVFLAADGKTLYFSSSGHPGFGSYDMYMSKRLDDTWTNWTKPLNLGDKINSPEMDIYYTIPAAGDYAYFSSGKTVYGMNDLYRIRLPKEIRPEYVDMSKLVAGIPQSNIPTTSVNTTLQPKTIPQTTTTSSNVPVNTTTDDLQDKIAALKQQQNQIKNTPNNNVSSLPVNNAVKVEHKTENVNYITPAKMPEKQPNVLTKEELANREQQRINPTVNPNNDRLNNLTNKPMTQTINQEVKVPEEKVITPTVNYAINEVNPTQNETLTSNTLRTAPINNTAATDDLQQKLDELKRQQAQISSTPTSTQLPATTVVLPTSVRQQYPDPQPVQPTGNSQTEQLEKKLQALKEQQNQVQQSTTLSNPYSYYEPKPYDPQPVKPQVEDVSAQQYDTYQDKLQALKQQQQQIKTEIIPTTTPTDVETKQEIPSKNEQAKITYTPDPKQQQKAAAIISKYEDKLQKLQAELETLKSPIQEDKVLAATISEPIKDVNIPSSNIQQVQQDSSIINSTQLTQLPINKENSADTTSAQLPETFTLTSMSNPYNFDSIEQAHKTIEQDMLAAINKMDTKKQTLENDIDELKTQREKFNSENDKLTTQNTQLSKEKEDLEAQKKQMDDLLKRMQEENDKLAAEKLKMEQDKAKLDALRKQQEKEFFALKHSIDSLSNVKKNITNNANLQQNYDLFNVPLEVGAVAIADKIYFVADAAYLTIPSYPEIDKVVAFLKKNKNLKVEIGGHTNGLCDDVFCNKLSYDRAKTCVDYLISKGIDKNRLTYKGYGKQHLIASPGSPVNQRVEIKILSVQ